MYSSIRFTISIHALRVEGDAPQTEDESSEIISIHALRVEGDAFLSIREQIPQDFYPRPPGGGRLRIFEQGNAIHEFLSTPSGWRATAVL